MPPGTDTRGRSGTIGTNRVTPAAQHDHDVLTGRVAAPGRAVTPADAAARR